MPDMPPEYHAPQTLTYQTPPPDGNAPTLVRLAAIFMMITSGVDVLHALTAAGMIAFMHYTLHVAPPPPGPPRGLPPETIAVMVYGIPGAISLLSSPIVLFCALRLLRRKSWGWGLGGGILCCLHMWMFAACCVFYFFPLGTGIYSIIVLCLGHVRGYLARVGATDGGGAVAG